MSADIPPSIKSDLPPNSWGKALGLTPVVMTVIATLLAGLASSEMTRAQYARTLAAQLQAKAGDQWNLYQAKRLRSALQQDTLDLLSGSSEAGAVDPNAYAAAAAPANAIASADGRRALALLQQYQEVALPPAPVEPDELVRAEALIGASAPEDQIEPLLSKLDEPVLAAALRAAEDRADAFARSVASREQALAVLAPVSNSPSPAVPPALHRDLAALRLRYALRRYDTESRLNQGIALVYEVQVRKAAQSAERHRRRSDQFFYGMLAAQLGVVVSTLALAGRQRGLLWSVALAAGLVAVSIAAYVYVAV